MIDASAFVLDPTKQYDPAVLFMPCTLMVSFTRMGMPCILLLSGKLSRRYSRYRSLPPGTALCPLSIELPRYFKGIRVRLSDRVNRRIHFSDPGQVDLHERLRSE